MKRTVFLSALLLPFFAIAQVDQNYTVVEQGANSGVTKQDSRVIRSQGALKAFLKSMHETDSRAYDGFNWGKQMLIVVYGGQQPTGGYGVSIKKVATPSSHDMEVDALLVRPLPNAIVTPSITTPYVVVRTPKVNGKVTLNWVTD